MFEILKKDPKVLLMGKAEVYWTLLHDIMIQYYLYFGLLMAVAASMISMLGYLIISLSLCVSLGDSCSSSCSLHNYIASHEISPTEGYQQMRESEAQK